MNFSLMAGGIAFIVALLLGRPVIALLRARGVGKAISEDQPSTHLVKEGTPTMGGLFIFGAVAITTIPTNLFGRRSMLLPLMVVLITMAIGLIDDLGSLTGFTRRTLSWRLKFLLIGLLSAAVSWALFYQLELSSINIPWVGQRDVGTIYLLIAFVTVFATTSAVSITDGLDGLLGGTAAVAFASYAILAFLQGQDFLATFSFTVVGALLGFLWYNANPAQVFMGDTGALPLGAALATVALMTGHWLLLPVIGIVFVAEAVSDVLQIGYFRATHGQRLFRRTPLHHHFELLGWSEPQVVTRFWMFGIAGGMVGVALALSV